MSHKNATAANDDAAQEARWDHDGGSPPPRRKSRILLVEDHPIVRQGLALLINEEPDLEVCGHAEDVEGGHAAARTLRPDLVVVDLFLKGGDGLTLVKTLREEQPDLPTLVLSMHQESLHAERALRAGARGYVMKEEATAHVLRAIRKVLGGEVCVSDRVASRLLSRAVDGGGRGGGPLERLSDREFEVFSLLGQGVGPREIAERLSLSVKTVDAHRENIKSKLGIKSGPALLRFAIEYSMGERITAEPVSTKNAS